MFIPVKLKTEFKWVWGWERNTPTVYIGSLLSQELHPVPRKPLGNPLSNQTRLQHTNHQSSDLEPFKKHTPFGKTHQEYW